MEKNITLHFKNKSELPKKYSVYSENRLIGEYNSKNNEHQININLINENKISVYVKYGGSKILGYLMYIISILVNSNGQEIWGLLFTHVATFEIKDLSYVNIEVFDSKINISELEKVYYEKVTSIRDYLFITCIFFIPIIILLSYILLIVLKSNVLPVLIQGITILICSLLIIFCVWKNHQIFKCIR